MIVEVERIVENFDDELRGVQPSVDSRTGLSTDNLWMQSEAINISDTEDQSASAETKRKRDGSPISSSSKPRKAARSSGIALRKPPSPPRVEPISKQCVNQTTHTSCTAMHLRSPNAVVWAPTMGIRLILQMHRFRILRKITRPEILSLNPIYMIE
jgi:hypothetical protein